MRTKLEVREQTFGSTDLVECVILRTHGLSDCPVPPLDQCIKLKLPYEADSHPDLPSKEEIERAMKDKPFTLGSGNAICNVGELVVKRGMNLSLLQEAENMLYLEQHSQVRTAKVYAVYAQPRGTYQHPDGNDHDMYYLITEYIEGETLTESRWDSMGKEMQGIICDKLAEQMKLLRSVPAEGHYGRVHRQPWIADIYHTPYPEVFGGPFNTWDEFLTNRITVGEAELSIATILTEWTEQDKEFLSGFKSVLAGSKGSAPVLSHGDLAFHNMIIRPIMGDGRKIVDWELTIIDWELMAWSPALVEIVDLKYLLHSWRSPDSLMWDRFCAHFKDTYPVEVEYLQQLSKRFCFKLG